MLRSFYFTLFIYSRIINASQSKSWSYSSQPWDAGMCLKGDNQSPVILDFPGTGQLSKYFQKRDVSKDDLRAGKFLKNLNRETYRFKKVLSVKGQSVAFEFNPVIRSLSVSGNLKCPKYTCHFDSVEHVLKDDKTDNFAECQLECFDEKFNDYEDALFSSKKGAIQIFSIKYVQVKTAQNSENSRSVNRMIQALSTDRIVNFKFPILDEYDTYWQYEGSTTVPPCEEVVTWNVFLETVEISEQQVSKIRKLL